MCPSGVVRMYVKSCLSSSSARFWSVVLSTIHSPLWSARRCRYFCVVSSRLCPINCLTISAFCVLLSCLVTYACLRSYSLIESIVGSLSFLASVCFSLMKWHVYVLGVQLNSGVFGFMLCLVMCACSRAVSSGVIFSGGRWLHPLVTLAVMVFWSGCMSLVVIPFSPTISMGRSPVCALMSIFSDSCSCALAMSIEHLSWLGGCIAWGSSVYMGFSHVIL